MARQPRKHVFRVYVGIMDGKPYARPFTDRYGDCGPTIEAHKKKADAMKRFAKVSRATLIVEDVND